MGSVPELLFCIRNRSRGSRTKCLLASVNLLSYLAAMDTKPSWPPEVWERTPVEAQEYIRVLAARVAMLETIVERLQATVQQLTERVQQDSRTSSRPPSSDPPSAIGKRPQREPKGRRPGRQPGHAGQPRALVPIEPVEVGIQVKPARCSRCPHLGPGEEGQPQHHHVPEIPPVRPVVTEYQRHRLVCPVCGEVARAELPIGVPPGALGPRVQAMTAWCTGADHLSKRTTQRGMADRCGVSIRLGTLAHLERATARPVAEPVAEARRYGPPQPAADLDETGWREGPQRAWLWTAVTAGGTVFVVRRSRRGKVAQELMGAQLWGWWVTDRWSAYHWSPTWRRQLCWAPLWRDIEAMMERGGPSQAMGEAWRGHARQMCQWWQRVRDGPLSHASVASSRRPVRREGERLLKAGQTCGVAKTDGTCREIRKRRRAWWTFVRHEEGEPTNHAAERAIRPGVRSRWNRRTCPAGVAWGGTSARGAAG